MARRKNHGKRVPGGDLAEAALRKIVPEERVRLVRLQLVWDDAMPARLRGVAAPAAVDGEVLVVHVRDNQWLHELAYLRADLLARVHECSPQSRIASLKLRVGPVPSPPPPAATEPVREKVRLSMQPEPATLAAIASIGDEGLRHAIATARLALTELGVRRPRDDA
jgi:hypothetical protein